METSTMYNDEVMEAYLESKGFNQFEGERGVQRLEEVVKDLGYKEDGFKYGDPISSFLVDNPGCIEAIILWIEDNLTNEQIENLRKIMDKE
jgi:hypothetical protein